MDRPGHIPDGQISEVMNLHSQKLYILSTAPETGQDYWVTAVLPIIKQKKIFGLIKKNIPDFCHPIVSFIRNNKEGAYRVHAEVRHVLISITEDKWFENFPSLSPPDGYSVGARKKLKDLLGDIKKSSSGISYDKAVDIAAGYGQILELNPNGPFMVSDVKNLPYPKNKIKEALIILLRTELNSRMKEQIKFAYLCLANWQEGVGNLDVGLNFRTEDLNKPVIELVKQVDSQNKDWERWKPIVTAEQKSLQSELESLGLVPAEKIAEIDVKKQDITIETYKQMIKLKPDYAEAHYNLGVAYGALDRHQEAIEAYKQTIKLKPDLAEAHYNLGLAYDKLGRYQEAIEAYKQAIKLKPNYADAHYNLGIAYGKSDSYQEAIEACKHAIKLKPDNAKAYYNLGLAYDKSDRCQEAIAAYKQVIKLKPDDSADAHYNLGLTYDKSGRHQEAIEAYNQAIKLKPDFADAHNNLGVVYFKLGRHQEAINAYKQAIKLEPNYVGTHMLLGFAYGSLGHHQDAIEAYRQAIRLKPDDAAAHSILGLTYSKLSRHQEAIEAFKKAIKLKPNNAEVHYNLGIAYLQIGDKRSALQEYKILKTLDPEKSNKLLKFINK